jgi:hypothetical protein
MPKPVNFYGFSSGDIGNGLISAYPTNFSGRFYKIDGVTSYSGVFTPEALYKTPKAYPWGLDDDRYTPKEFSINYSGELTDSNLNTSTTDFSFRGTFYPVSSGDGDLSIRQTGQLKGNNIDAPTCNFQVTGSVTSGNLDIPTYNLTVYGQFPESPLDYNDFSNTISGNVYPQFTDFPTYQVGLSGNIIGYERDKLSLNVGIEGITWSVGNPLVSGAVTGDANISFGIEFIQWSFSN